MSCILIFCITGGVVVCLGGFIPRLWYYIADSSIWSLRCHASSLGELFLVFRWNIPSQWRTQCRSRIWNRALDAEDDMFLRNIGNHLPSDAASHPRNQETYSYHNLASSEIAPRNIRKTTFGAGSWIKQIIWNNFISLGTEKVKQTKQLSFPNYI
jgi:hypothetical protein